LADLKLEPAFATVSITGKDGRSTTRAGCLESRPAGPAKLLGLFIGALAVGTNHREAANIGARLNQAAGRPLTD
jgi:hypothetical protein